MGSFGGLYVQFNFSIQFICIAHFHKLEICLRVLYNLYISTTNGTEANGSSQSQTKHVDKSSRLQYIAVFSKQHIGLSYSGLVSWPCLSTRSCETGALSVLSVRIDLSAHDDVGARLYVILFKLKASTWTSGVKGGGGVNNSKRRKLICPLQGHVRYLRRNIFRWPLFLFD